MGVRTLEKNRTVAASPPVGKPRRNPLAAGIILAQACNAGPHLPLIVLKSGLFTLMHSSSPKLLLPFMLALSAAPAVAQLTNGDFSAGLAAWNSIGDVGIRADGAFLTTANAGGIDNDASLNFTGNSAVPGAFIETTLFFPAGALDPDNAGGILAIEGSLLYRDFTVQAGQILRFDYIFYSNELSADFAFVLFDALRTDLESQPRLAPADYGYDYATGAKFFSSAPASETRTVRLAIGIIDIGDENGASALRVDNITLTAVPEPASFATLAGLTALALTAGRRRQNRRRAAP